jgi:dolichol-phosphate mannosyltransferase
MSSPELTVVIPVYGCAGCLDALNERLHASLDPVLDDWDVVYVDDASPDGAWSRLEELAHADPRVRALRLSRNFGQHAAITAGLAESRGRWVVVMDCDLQDRPEEIPKLYRAAIEGHDIVFGKRVSREDPWLRRLATRAYLMVANRFLKLRIDGRLGSFSIISDRVRDAFLTLRDKDRHYLFILYWLGFEHTSVDVGRDARHEGESSYTFPALVRHALDGVFFQTTVLLRWIVYLGFALSLVGVILAGVFVAIFFTGNPYPGWTSLAVLLLVVGGFIIMSTGVTGLYIGKIFEQVKERPLYVVDRRIGARTPELERELARGPAPPVA